MKTLTASLALAAAMLAAGAAAPTQAAGLRDPGATLFRLGDQNADGKLDATEMRALREARFERLDRNRDGVLSGAEIDQAMARVERAAEMATLLMDGGFDRLDRDGDGLVSQSEFVDREASLIVLLDDDGDGAVSRAEFDRLLDGLKRL